MERRRLRRGYDTTHLNTQVNEQLKQLEKTKPHLAVIEAVITITSIPALAVIYCGILLALGEANLHPALLTGIALPLYFVVATLIARQQRGLELMVHDASHGSWCRSNRKLNDVLANMIVAAPVLSWISAYWKSHRIHHGTYGGDEDPCRRRFAAMGIGHIDLSTRTKIAIAVAKWLPQYNLEYYKEIGSLSLMRWLAFWIWHIAIMVAPTAVFLKYWTGMTTLEVVPVAACLWVVFWMLPATAFLPILRSIAESEEHDYDAGSTEFDTTYSNLGWWHRALFHPKNDAYHVIHHMFPNIPERVHHKVHRILMEHDERYRSSLMRKKVLDRA
jgi:fatty acid desaturase